MSDPFRNYDSWLEAPYQRAQAEGEAFEAAADRYDLDPDKDADEIQRRMDAEHEEYAERVAEDRAAHRRGDW
jgi:hypothetical protein